MEFVLAHTESFYVKVKTTISHTHAYMYNSAVDNYY